MTRDEIFKEVTGICMGADLSGMGKTHAVVPIRLMMAIYNLLKETSPAPTPTTEGE